jgi:ATP synthase protein I
MPFAPAFPEALAHNIGRRRFMAEDEPNGDPTSPQDARLSSLNERLKQAEKVEAERAPDQIDASTVVKNVGQRVAQSLIGMPLGGAIIGWLLDRLFDTAPWIMLGLMFIGFAGAVLDVMRYSRQGSNKGAGK